MAQLRRMTGKRSMPVPGDVVDVRILEDERTVVDRIERPRVFASNAHRSTGGAKTMAANVDLARDRHGAGKSRRRASRRSTSCSLLPSSKTSRRSSS